MNEFTTIGELRKLLATDAPDDRAVVCQVVGADGSAWNLVGSFHEKTANGNVAVLQLKHPDLKALPKII